MLPAQDAHEQSERYKEEVLQEGILGYMARMGISTVSAYRGSKVLAGRNRSRLGNLLGINTHLVA